ncbi:uridine-cytidine kinase-like 1 isoform X14 [Aotus nancymaae]|uniref:uridine-cytidine kinase-like 1 isoform X14 n=1 Tax=Aotus nancymaae TaxID=37293 RepID=UPI000B50804E|nr:uridine-cytidine kinase-like 1 isoform X8 [Aotus nancymaae]
MRPMHPLGPLAVQEHPPVFSVMSSPPAYPGIRISGCRALGAEGSSNAESLDRLLPPVGAGRSPRKRTTSQCKSEPPLLRTSKRTIYTAGRPPWYNEHGTQSKEAFAIGLGGGSASGKTTVARMIIEALDVPWVVLLSMDSFYKVLTEQQQEQAAHNNFNFDHPDAFDFDLIISTLKKLKQGKSVKVPIYDFTTHSRKKDWKTLYGANVIIFEGIMAFADKTLLELLDMKIFVDTDSDIRLVRRLRRDISERGRDIEGVIKQYNKFVKPAFDQYIQPTMRLADIVVPRGSGNTVAIDLIVQHVHSQLEERELSVRGSYVGICEQSALWCCCVPRLPVAPCPPLRHALPVSCSCPAPFPAVVTPLFCPAPFTPLFCPCHTPSITCLSCSCPTSFPFCPHHIQFPTLPLLHLFCPCHTPPLPRPFSSSALPHSLPRSFPAPPNRNPCHAPFLLCLITFLASATPLSCLCHAPPLSRLLSALCFLSRLFLASAPPFSCLPLLCS